jgi:hypothetical protein
MKLRGTGERGTDIGKATTAMESRIPYLLCFTSRILIHAHKSRALCCTCYALRRRRFRSIHPFPALCFSCCEVHQELLQGLTSIFVSPLFPLVHDGSTDLGLGGDCQCDWSDLRTNHKSKRKTCGFSATSSLHASKYGRVNCIPSRRNNSKFHVVKTPYESV